MKKIILALIVFPFLFSSCIDNVEDYKQENVLIGTWKIAEIGTANSNNVVVYTSNSNGICSDDTLTFNEDATFDIVDYTLVAGNCQSTSINGTYDVEIKTITLTYMETINNVSQEVKKAYTIVSLFKNEAILAYSDSLGVIRYLKVERILEI